MAYCFSFHLGKFESATKIIMGGGGGLKKILRNIEKGIYEMLTVLTLKNAPTKKFFI